MPDDTTGRPGTSGTVDVSRPFDGRLGLFGALYEKAKAGRWQLSKDGFQKALARSIQKRFSAGQLTASRLEEYAGALHLEDLALACACAEGNDAAWEHFVATYRNYLYAAAAAITRRPASDPYAREFADSLYATLYSKGSGAGAGRNSLFHHFHGRSKLSTWLRAVLAQRYVDVLRQEKHFEQLEDEEGNERPDVVLRSVAAPLSDPERPRYVQYLADALAQAISSLDEVDRSRLISYYLDEMTLAEIGKVTREHEATVSRKLERIRGELKERVFEILREEKTALNGQAARSGLSEAQIQLCLEYAAEEWPFDLGRVLSGGLSRSAKSLSPPDTAAKKD
jgi:RNA polymerase sigma-70 factor